MNDFILVTERRISAAPDVVWDALYDVQAWPEWGPYVKQVSEFEPGDQDGLGARCRFVWGTRLPYRIVFETRVTGLWQPELIDCTASGDLNGHGQWQWRAGGKHTLARYEWRETADKLWIGVLAPVLRPMFIWNHGGVMRAGEDGLLRWLSVQCRPEQD